MRIAVVLIVVVVVHFVSREVSEYFEWDIFGLVVLLGIYAVIFGAYVYWSLSQDEKPRNEN